MRRRERMENVLLTLYMMGTLIVWAVNVLV